MPEQQGFKFWSLKEFAEKYLTAYRKANEFVKSCLAGFSYDSNSARMVLSRMNPAALTEEERNVFNQMYKAYELGNQEAQKNFQLVGVFIENETVSRPNLVQERWPEVAELIKAQKITPKMAENFLETASHQGGTIAAGEARKFKAEMSRMVDMNGQWIPSRYATQLKIKEPNATIKDFYNYAKTFNYNDEADRAEAQRIVQTTKEMLDKNIKNIDKNASQEEVKDVFFNSWYIKDILNDLGNSAPSPEIQAEHRKHINEIALKYDPIKFLEKHEKLKTFNNGTQSEVFQKQPKQLGNPFELQALQNGMK